MKRALHIVVLGSLLGLLAFWAASAETTDIAGVNQVSWWTRRAGAQPAGPAKFEVAAGVQGDESVAALRVLIHGDVTKATLSLAEISAPLSGVAAGKVRVCTTSQPWLMVDGGKYDDAPKPDCGSAVEMTRAVDASGVATWSGDVTSMLTGARSEVTLIVVPSPDKAAVIPPTYFITMVAGIRAEGTPDAVVSTTPSPTPPTSGVRPAPAAPFVTSPGTPLDTTPTTAAPTPATAPADSTQPKRFQVAASSRPGKPWGKLVLLLPLAAFLGVLYAGAQRFAQERGFASR